MRLLLHKAKIANINGFEWLKLRNFFCSYDQPSSFAARMCGCTHYSCSVADAYSCALDGMAKIWCCLCTQLSRAVTSVLGRSSIEFLYSCSMRMTSTHLTVSPISSYGGNSSRFWLYKGSSFPDRKAITECTDSCTRLQQNFPCKPVYHARTYSSSTFTQLYVKSNHKTHLQRLCDCGLTSQLSYFHLGSFLPFRAQGVRPD